MPKAQRSRACNQCRERRVKCDETPDICQQCRRLGLKCSGPIQGSVIIDMTDKVTKPRQRKKRDKPTVVVREDHPKEQLAHSVKAGISEGAQTETASPLSVVLSPKENPPEKRKSSLQGQDAITALRMQYKLPMLYQPSLADAFDHAFINHFVELNRGVRHYRPQIPWINRLPGLLMGANTLALKLSIRAASMAFYAQLHKDPPILVDSYRWYTISLNSQRMALARLDGKRIPNDEECLVPIILGLYEVYAGTTPASVFHHLNAATRILEMRGPSNCSSGPCAPLFRAVRISDAHKAVVFNQPSLFSTPEWMTLPFSIQPKNAHQYLADILLQIPDCIGLCELNCSLSGFFARTIPPSIDLKPVHDRANDLLLQLEEWAERHPHLCTTQPTSQVTTVDMATHVDVQNPSHQTPALVLPDIFVALTTATYKATYIILTLLLHKICPKTSISSVLNPDSTSNANDPASDFIIRATKHAGDILDIGDYIESTHPVGFDFLRSVFPLVIVVILGPQPKDQKLARQMLERWGDQRGLGGICGAWVGI